MINIVDRKGRRVLLGKFGGVICALALSVGCQVPAPTVEQGLAYGFHSPLSLIHISEPTRPY